MDELYLQVGRVSHDGTKDMIDDYIFEKLCEYPNRKLIKVLDRHSKTTRILAVYDEWSIDPFDLEIIKRHNQTVAEYEGKQIKYYSFTHNHFLETLKQRKLNLIKKSNLMDLYDGTIFGRVERTTKIPEHTEIIPEHDETIYVDWDDWNDYFETEQTQRD
jgi:hypothetical protein